MFASLLDEIQRILTPLALAAFTGFIAWLFVALRQWFGIEESVANEEAIRRAAETEAGKLVASGATDASSVALAAAKIVADLSHEVDAEGYNKLDIGDMILGAIPGLAQTVIGAIKK